MAVKYPERQGLQIRYGPAVQLAVELKELVLLFSGSVGEHYPEDLVFG